MDEMKQLHLYEFENLLRPRGGKLQKESLSTMIYERLKSTYESWVDDKYADSKTPEQVISRLIKNLQEETMFALEKFLDETTSDLQVREWIELLKLTFREVK